MDSETQLYCEYCGRLRADVQWRNNTEQYECQECYQQYLEHTDQA